ncbi:MAG: ABC transporter permease subunit/CPBP intramembrane protease [Planctomycetaceae bacterium]
MSPRNVKLVFLREVRDQLRDRRTLFMIVVLPLLLYPSLGIGMFQMMTTFREQPREVLVLGVDHLPDEPQFMDADGIRTEWFSGGEADVSKLTVKHNGMTVLAGESSEDSKAAAEAERLRLRIEKVDELLAASIRKSLDTPSDQSRTPDDKKLAKDVATEALRESGADVLVIIPKGFGDGVGRPLKDSEGAPKYSGPLVINNSADEKSMVASSRVLDALSNWEEALLSKRLNEAGLPADTHRPAKISQLDVAQTEQIAANMWSKLFPALLIIMTVTGAFYPAIDLGAGEKERGTMETLLISPAFRSEIVLGKFLTVMLFSCGTALLNLASMGFTGQYMVSMVGQQQQLSGSMAFPPMASLFWLFVMLIPIAALFSALCLGLATFAKSSKEGQYYLTPLLMITMGLTVFCLSPTVEITPLYSVLPVVNVALLLKGMLLAPVSSQTLYAYIFPVLISSAGYSLIALWWAIELFGSEAVLFRAAERVSPRLWLRHTMANKLPRPSFSQAIFCFVAIMFLQFAAMGPMQKVLGGDDSGSAMLKVLVFQQIFIIAAPAILMSLLLTTSVKETLRLRLPSIKHIVAAIGLALVLHPLAIELLASLQGWFFPALPPELTSQMTKMMSAGQSNAWVMLAVFALAPGICEEIAFRGFILSGLNRSGRTGLAIVGSAAAFGIMHMIPQQVFNASLLGLLIGLLAIRSRSLLVCIVFHVLYNSLGVLHGMFGSLVTTDGIFGYLFRQEEGMLRYSPLLLGFAAVIAYRLICWIGSDEASEEPVSSTIRKPAVSTIGSELLREKT